MGEKYGVGVRSMEYYVLHDEHAREAVPMERLLEFDARDGWEPLYAFWGEMSRGGVSA